MKHSLRFFFSSSFWKSTLLVIETRILRVCYSKRLLNITNLFKASELSGQSKDTSHGWSTAVAVTVCSHLATSEEARFGFARWKKNKEFADSLISLE